MATNNEILENVARVEKQLSEIATKIKSDMVLCLDKYFEPIKGDISTLLNRVNKVEHDVNKLEARIEAIEKESRSCDLVVTGIPIMPNENVNTIINKISEVIDYTINNSFYRMFRIKTNSSKQKMAPPIIVKFYMKSAAIDFFNKYRAKNNLALGDINIDGSNSRIYINGGLTTKNADIWREAKQRETSGEIFKVYIKSGSIFAMKSPTLKPKLLQNLQDIDQMILNHGNDQNSTIQPVKLIENMNQITKTDYDKRKTRATTKSSSSTK